MVYEAASNRAVVEKLPPYFFTEWYARHGRRFPWRDPRTDPFRILLAEVLLRQTRAEMIVETWQELSSRYPSPAALAAASPKELLGLVKRLGLGRQRTRALKELAVAIAARGGVPATVEELARLPHCGLYTAHAVACFAFGLRVPVVDLSILRVLSRLSGAKPPRDIRRAKEIWEIAWAILPPSGIAEHNYGLLDFAAAVCKPRNPGCSDCPLAQGCAYFQVSRATPGQAHGTQ